MVSNFFSKGQIKERRSQEQSFTFCARTRASFSFFLVSLIQLLARARDEDSKAHRKSKSFQGRSNNNVLRLNTRLYSSHTKTPILTMHTIWKAASVQNFRRSNPFARRRSKRIRAVRCFWLLRSISFHTLRGDIIITPLWDVPGRAACCAFAINK